MPRADASPSGVELATPGRGWILDANNANSSSSDDAMKRAKREYFRDHMVAFRQRKKQSLENMKAMHAALETQLQQRLVMRRAILLSGFALRFHESNNQHQLPDLAELAPDERRRQLQDAHLALVDEAETCRAEIKALQSELEQYVKLKLLLHYELGLLQVANTDDSTPNANTDDTPIVPTQLRGFFTYFVENEPPFYYEPFTREECDAFMEDGYNKVRQLQEFFDTGSVQVQQAYCLGWRAQRSLERTYVADGVDGPLISRVRFTKRVRAPDGEALALLHQLSAFAYRCLESVDEYSRIQRTRFVSHTLQTFGRKHQVSVRNAPDAAGTTNIRYVHLLTHVEEQFDNNTKARSTVLMLAIDTPRHQLIREMMPNPEVFWITEGTAFISFTQVDESHLDIDFGNVTKCMSDEQAQYFMIELGAQLIRWENMVIPPRLLRF